MPLVRSLRLILAGAVAAAAALPPAGAVAAAPRPLALGDIFRIDQVSTVRVSPRARRVAYVRTHADVTTDRRIATIHVVGIDGRGDRALGDGTASEGDPAWQGDDRIAFVRDGGDGPRIVIADLARGTQAEIATGPLHPQALAWSPDGKRLAFFAATPEAALPPPAAAPAGAGWAKPARVIESPAFQTIGQAFATQVRIDLYVVDAATGAAPRAILAAPVGYSTALVRASIAWTPDGRQIVFAANAHKQFWRNVILSDVMVADVASGGVTILSKPGSSSYDPVVSPDGKRIAFLCWDTPQDDYIRHDICIADRATGTVRHVPNLADERLSGIRWMPDGRHLAGALERAGMVEISMFDLAGHARKLAETGGGDLSAYTERNDVSVARDGTIGFVMSDPARPGDVAVIRPGQAPRIITAVNAALLAERSLATVEPVSYPSADPRFTIHGILWKPPGYDPARRYPLFILLHGGRSLVFGPDFDIDAEMIAAQGYLVLMPNYRSSGGYGTAFASSISAYPAGLEQDVIGAAGAMAARADVDPQRLFLGGGSGGGVITGWTIGHDTRFRAAAMWFPTVDWASNDLEAATGFSGHYDSFLPDPLAERAKLAARSPLTYIGSVSTPTLLVVGDQDRITPMSQSIMFFNGLSFRNVPAQLQIVPGEPHGVRVRPSHELGLIQATLAWFARFGSGIAPAPLDLPQVRR